MPTIDGLFGPIEIAAPKPRQIKFKQIKAVYEVLTVQEDIGNYLKPNQRYTNPSQIFDTFNFLQFETKEYFIALHLSGKNSLICVDIVSTGSLNASIVHPRELFKTALLSSAAAILLVHNHPSGSPEPSTEDLSITKRLIEAGDLVGIKILDHIIVGSTYYSFVERGVI
jgi:DNA repair protein RadC